MDMKDKAKELYDKAEGEVDGFFVRNEFTVLIMAAVAVALVVLLFT